MVLGFIPSQLYWLQIYCRFPSYYSIILSYVSKKTSLQSIIYLSLLLPTVPSSPENVTLTTSSSPLRVTWSIDLPIGLVSNYTIYVTRLERGNTVVNYTSTDIQLLQFDVPNLDPYELVEVSVSASNSAGEGPRSPGVRGRIREERKCSELVYYRIIWC